MLLSLVLLIVFGLTVFDPGPVGATLRRGLVETPARTLNRLTRGRVVGLILILVLGVAAVALFESEGLRLFSMAAPDLVAWTLMFDVTVIFDLVVLTASLRIVAGWRGLGRATEAVLGLGRRLRRSVRRSAGSRTRRIRRPRPPRAGCEDPDGGFAGAWACPQPA